MGIGGGRESVEVVERTHHAHRPGVQRSLERRQVNLVKGSVGHLDIDMATEFLLVGAVGARLDHSLVNVYILSALENRGCRGMIVDDYSEMEIISSKAGVNGVPVPGKAEIEDKYRFFSLIALEGDANGVTIQNAKFNIAKAVIGPDYQYATSNEVLPGKTAEITVEDGRLLLIKIN